MNIRFRCPNCQTKYSAQAEQSGKEGNCKKCGARIKVPTSSNSHSYAADFFDRLTDSVATDFTSKGEGTGGWSKVISGLIFPLFTALSVVLLKQGEYLALAALLVLGFTKLGSLVITGLLIYVIYQKEWVAVGLLAAYFLMVTFSFYIGKRNVKRLLLSGKPMIGPFEGAPDVIFWIILQCLLLAGALLAKGWIAIILWVLFALITLHLLSRYLYRLFPRWRQIHNPLMFRYAVAAGEETAKAETEARDFDFASATLRMLSTVYPEKSEQDLDSLLHRVEEKLQKFSDRPLLAQLLTEQNPNAKMEQIDDILAKINALIQQEARRSLLVRWAIAEVVQDVFGSEERARYLLAVFNGKAR